MSTITLIVGERELRNWTRWEVEADLLTPVDAWSLSIGRWDVAHLRWVQPGQLVTLRLDDQVVLKGRIDEVRTRTAGDSRLLEVLGRDLGANLADCHPPPRTLQGQTLAQLASWAMGQLGISAPVEATGAASETIAYATVEPGETAWEFLDRYARRQAVLMWWSPAGTLKIAAPPDAADPVFQLRHGTEHANVIESEVAWSIAERYSTVTVMGQAEGFLGESHAIEATVADTDLEGLSRSLRIHDRGATTWRQADRRATWERDRRRAEGLKCSYTVPGHFMGGRLWEVGELVHVDDRLHGLDEALLISGVRLSYDLQRGSRTRLTLRRKGALLGLPDPPPATGGGLF